MQEKTNSVLIRFSSPGTFESNVGHQVRTITERDLCDWLSGRGIAHRHGSEAIIVKAAANDSPSLFVPDIMLTKKSKDGRVIIIEALHNFSPKRGGLKSFAAFARQYRDSYYTILVGKKSSLESIPRGTCDARVDCGNLALLARKLNLATKENELRPA